MKRNENKFKFVYEQLFYEIQKYINQGNPVVHFSCRHEKVIEKLKETYHIELINDEVFKEKPLRSNCNYLASYK